MNNILDAYTSMAVNAEEDNPSIEASKPETVQDDSWMLMLVNRWNPLPEGYTVQLVDVPGGVQVDERIYQPLMEMLDAATEAGVGPIVVSGYRTQEKQQSLYDEKINEFLGEGYPRKKAIAQAQQWVSVPGTSEHQTGLAVDINGMIWDVYPWLAENSYKYGFILRYPEDKTEITGRSMNAGISVMSDWRRLQKCTTVGCVLKSISTKSIHERRNAPCRENESLRFFPAFCLCAENSALPVSIWVCGWMQSNMPQKRAMCCFPSGLCFSMPHVQSRYRL